MSAASPRADFAAAFPASTKVYVTGACAGERVAVPMREIALSGGEPPLQVYDTSGPQDCDVRQGLPPDSRRVDRPPRAGGRSAAVLPARAGQQRRPRRFPPRLRRRRCCAGQARSRSCTTRARGEVTPEMAFVAVREGLDAEFVRSGDRARPRDPAGEHQPPGNRADDHRPELPGEDQRQHRQLRGHLVDRGGSREAALGDALGRRHGDGSLDGTAHPRNARVDHPQLRGARSAPCRSTRRSRRWADVPRS